LTPRHLAVVATAQIIHRRGQAPVQHRNAET
jgi:hypothetical protein